MRLLLHSQSPAHVQVVVVAAAAATAAAAAMGAVLKGIQSWFRLNA